MTEVRGQMTENRSQKTDDRSRVGHRTDPDQAGTVARTTLSCGAAGHRLRRRTRPRARPSSPIKF